MQLKQVIKIDTIQPTYIAVFGLVDQDGISDLHETNVRIPITETAAEALLSPHFVRIERHNDVLFINIEY